MTTPQAAILGVGETAFTRGTSETSRTLLLQSAIRACRDAGVDPKGIDGLVTIYDHQIDIGDVAALGADDLAFHCHVGIGGASAVAGVTQAAMAVQRGMASRVLVVAGWRGYSGDVRFGSATDTKLVERPGRPNLGIRRNLEAPYGLIAPMQLYALHANRWLSDCPRGQEGMKTVALTMREHAQANDQAYMKGRLLTEDAYETANIPVEPFRIFDISLETDGAAAVIVGRVDGVDDRTQRPVYVAGGASGHCDVPDDISSRADVTQMGIAKAAPRALHQAGIELKDVDFAQLYDCFSFIVLRQLEEMGFCERGESADFVANGRIGRNGDLPVNTHGGLLSQAHVLGMNHVVEAVRQLRGTAGEAQLPNAEIGIVTGYGNFADGSIAVLHK